MDELTYDSLKLVQISCPYHHLGNEQAEDIFSKLLRTRKLGYSSRHNDKALPVDTYDFIGDHFLITSEMDTGFKVLGGYRMVSLKRAGEYTLPFPLQQLLVSANAQQHLDLLKNFFQDPQYANRDFTYVGSWTIDPVTRKIPGMPAFLQKLVTSMNVLSHEEKRSEIRFACGIPRLKTDQYIGWLGYKPVTNGDEALPEIHQANLRGEPVRLMFLENGHSVEAVQTAEKFKMLWLNRIYFGMDSQTDERKIAS